MQESAFCTTPRPYKTLNDKDTARVIPKLREPVVLLHKNKDTQQAVQEEIPPTS